MRAGEEERILQHHGEMLAQRGQIVLAQIDAVEQNLPGGHVVEAHHQAGQRGFAGAGVADDGHRLARLDGEGNVLQNPLDVVDRGKLRAMSVVRREFGLTATDELPLAAPASSF